MGDRPVDGLLPPRTEDTVLHEVAHFVDFSTRKVVRERSQPPTLILNEALGDILSHGITQRSCHKAGASDDAACQRTMNDEPTPISSSVDPYTNGQAARLATWKLMHGRNLQDFGARLLDARDRALADLPGIDGASLLRKRTPEERSAHFAHEAAAATGFVRYLE